MIELTDRELVNYHLRHSSYVRWLRLCAAGCWPCISFHLKLIIIEVEISQSFEQAKLAYKFILFYT